MAAQSVARVALTRGAALLRRAGRNAAATALQATSTFATRSPPARHRQAVAEQAAGGVRVPKAERTHVTLRAPGEAPRLFDRLTQSGIADILRLHGADGFISANGNLSRSLVDLPESGDMDLVLPGELPIATQVGNLQRSAKNRELGKEQQLCAFLQDAASKEHAGSPIVVLQTEPFKDLRQQDIVQLDAAVKVDDTLYAGEHKMVLGEDGVADIAFKLTKIRAALRRNSSPDLVAALHGVSRVKLYLAGEAVRAGMAKDELVNLAAAAGANVVLLSGQALGLASEPVPPLQLQM